MSKPKIKLTATYNHSEGGFEPVSRFNVNQRISHRGSENFHISQIGRPDKQLTQAERLERYECLCLEQMKRPYTYTEAQWQDYLREVASEEHTERCEAKNAWMYEH